MKSTESEQIKFLSDITLIKKAAESKKLVVFVGSGVSLNSGLPSWSSLIDELRNNIGITKSDTDDHLQVAQVFYNQRKHKEYVEKIRHELLYKKARYNQLHEAIFDLNPEHVVTTNYDDCLEQVIRKRALSFSVIKDDKDFPYAANNNLLVKMHGDLDNDNFVLKEDDYLNYEFNHPLFEAFIKATFSTKLVVFIGYSYSDVNLKIILQKVRNILGKDYQNSYMLTFERFSTYKKDYLNNRGVNVISYSENNEFIDLYLNGDNAIGKIFFRDSVNIDEYGRQLLNLIRFISSYDSYKENLKHKNLLHQIYFSLERYSELKSLPFYFIANLYPFNDEYKRVYHDSQASFTLAVNNVSILEFFQNNTINDNGITCFTYEYITVIKSEERGYVEKLDYVINILNSSGIHYLDLSRHQSEKVYEKQRTLQLRRNYREVCTCYRCLYEGLKFDKLLMEVSKASVTESSLLDNDMLLAYTHYKLGNIYLSCKLFEEIGQKAWNTGKLITYFITKYNYKYLVRFIDFAEYKHIDRDETEKIEEIGNSIDLDDIYRQIGAISKEESFLIRDIRDDKVLIYCRNEIDQLYNNVLNTYKAIQNGSRYQMAVAYHIDIYYNLIVINNFYQLNCIVKDGFSMYIKAINNALKSLLIYSTFKGRYPNEIPPLDVIFCRCFILYGNAEDYKKFFEEFSIDDIEVNGKFKDELTSMALSYFGSYHSGRDSFGDTTLNMKVYNQSIKGLFNDGLKKFFDLLLILLSKIDLGEESIHKIVPELILYLEIADFMYWKNIEYLGIFMKKNRKYLNASVYESFIKLVTKNSSLVADELLETIGYSLKDEDSEGRINDASLIDDIIKLVGFDNKKKKSFGQNTIIYVWMLSGDFLRKDIKKNIEDKLKNSFDLELYKRACFSKIIDYSYFINLYIDAVNYKRFDKGAELADGEFNDNDIDFINFIIFVYYCDMNFEDDRLKVFSEIKSYMHFYLNPEFFDYSNFKPEWLKLISSFYVHNRLKKFPKIRESIRGYLKVNEDNELSKLFVKYYL